MLSQRSSAVLAWLLAGLLLAASLWRLVPVWRAQVAAPFDLISEGPHLCTVQAIERGVNIYARKSFLDLPFFMTPYTPLYHVIVAAMPQDPANPFFTGRIVATIFMVAAAATLLVAAGPTHRSLGLLALSVFFLFPTVTGNTAYLRSDTMAICAAAWAALVAARGRGSRAALMSGALCGLAFAAKQSFVAAGIACFMHFLRHTPRRLFAFIAGGAIVVAALAVAATAHWGVDFWLAITIPLTDYGRDIESFFLRWHIMFAPPIFPWLIVTAVVMLIAALVGARRAALATPFFPYVIASWVCQTWVMTGIGAAEHNLIEPVLATLLWLVATERASAAERAAASETRDTSLRLGWVHCVVLTALVACVTLELRNTDPSLYSYTDAAKTARYLRAREEVNAALRARGLEHGRMLNLKNSQVVHDYVGDFVLNDLFMYISVLWNTRPETVDRLVRAIEHDQFDAVFVGPGVFSAHRDVGDQPWARIVNALFAAHYTVAIHGEQVDVLTRRGAPSS